MLKFLNMWVGAGNRRMYWCVPGAQVLDGGNRGQNSVDHSHYFIANEERGDRLPVARVPHVDGIIGSR